MVSALSQQGISLQLTPMQLPEAVPQPGVALAEPNELATAAIQENLRCLVLHPGEPARMSLQVQNWEAGSLRLILGIEGSFPVKWYKIVTPAAATTTEVKNNSRNSRLRRSPESYLPPVEWQEIGPEGIEVTAKGSWTGELVFSVPNNFFEDRHAITSGKTERLNLDLHGSLSVYAHRSIKRKPVLQLMEQADFNLYVRPHSNYVNFLPILYREVDFINRFIAIFEQAFEPVVNSFNSMWANLDPLTCPQALLPFLAHWVAWPVEPHWSLNHQRRLIRRAVEIYRWRGTRKGLRLYLHLYTGLPETDQHISITAPFGQGMVLGNSRLGEDTVVGGGNPYHFVVRLRSDRNTKIDEQLVRQIIDSEKPAFCTYELIIENSS